MSIVHSHSIGVFLSTYESYVVSGRAAKTLRAATSSHAAMESGSGVTPPCSYVAVADSSSWLWRRSALAHIAASIHRGEPAKER